MNERIQELAKQAGYNGHYATEEFDVDEFARLLVLECADLFEVEWGEEKLTGNDVGSIVKKHFGVEK